MLENKKKNFDVLKVSTESTFRSGWHVEAPCGGRRAASWLRRRTGARPCAHSRR